ncbi:MAG TPA: methionine adenosyltransferase [Streptosporangiaceae bacterium]|nr:methionine adenosyltransferase [Streptosporangiaceae bacterium]
MLAATDAFDLIGVGDCLPEVMPVIAGIARGGSRPATRVIGEGTATARMDSLAPDYSLWPAGRYFPVFPVEFSRGCRQHCPFCTDPVLRRGVAVDPVERTMATLETLAAGNGRIWVRFVDSSLSSLGTSLDRLLDAMTAACLPVEWGAYTYPHDIDAGLTARLARAGCRALFLGIESLAQGVRVGALAERMSVAYSRYCLQNFGAVLHHNLDKVYLRGGHCRTGLGAFEMTAPVTLLIGGRVSTSFGGQPAGHRRPPSPSSPGIATRCASRPGSTSPCTAIPAQ